jgi:hypothetical protein
MGEFQSFRIGFCHQKAPFGDLRWVQAQDLRRVLDGEVVARSAAVARLREAEKAVAGTHAASLELSPTPPGVTPAQRNTDDRAALDARLAALQAEVDAHSEEVTTNLRWSVV